MWIRMKYGVDIRSNEQLIAWLDQQGIPYQTLGMSYRNEPIVCVHKEGKGRPVFLRPAALQNRKIPFSLRSEIFA